jgi:hypothetical protein
MGLSAYTASKLASFRTLTAISEGGASAPMGDLTLCHRCQSAPPYGSFSLNCYRTDQPTRVVLLHPWGPQQAPRGAEAPLLVSRINIFLQQQHYRVPEGGTSAPMGILSHLPVLEALKYLTFVDSHSSGVKFLFSPTGEAKVSLPVSEGMIGSKWNYDYYLILGIDPSILRYSAKGSDATQLRSDSCELAEGRVNSLATINDPLRRGSLQRCPISHGCPSTINVCCTTKLG